MVELCHVADVSLLARSLTHSLTRSLTHSLTHSLAHSLTHQQALVCHEVKIEEVGVSDVSVNDCAW